MSPVPHRAYGKGDSVADPERVLIGGESCCFVGGGGGGVVVVLVVVVVVVVVVEVVVLVVGRILSHRNDPFVLRHLYPAGQSCLPSSHSSSSGKGKNGNQF